MESQIVDASQKDNSLNEFQMKELKKAEENLEKMKHELSTRKYLVEMKKEDIQLLLDFIEKDAPWKFTECLGIVEVQKDLRACLKAGKFFATAVAIEATYYYLSKVEGKGIATCSSSFKHVDDYLRIIKAITGGVERIKADGEKIKNAEFIVAARREGVEPDASLTEQ